LILAAAPTSDYQLLKLRLLHMVPVSKDAAHIYIGMACLVLALLVLRVPLRSYRALVPGLIATVVMEAFDLRDNMADFGHRRWWASLHDAVNTNLIPAVLVTIARLGWLRK
jgi:hypothetical protein